MILLTKGILKDERRKRDRKRERNRETLLSMKKRIRLLEKFETMRIGPITATYFILFSLDINPVNDDLRKIKLAVYTDHLIVQENF
jgi:hypothetical protein